jgi:predicted MFS family arabinose efflux permease
VNPSGSPHSSERAPAPQGADVTRLLVFLTLAAFCVSINIRVTDPLLPTLADEFATTAGKVSVVAIFYAIAHGFMQLAGGPFGDRYGKLRVITIAAFAAAGATAATALAASVAQLAALRFLSGAAAAIIVPLAFAYVGDTIAYERRQVVLARMFGGAMLGSMLGQAASGILADYLGWRTVFLLTGALFTVAALGLTFARAFHARHVTRNKSAGILTDLATPFRLLRFNEPRLVLGVCAAEGAFVMSAATFLGAYLHEHFGLSFTQIGIILALFGGGGLTYTLVAGWLIARLNERQRVTYGGLVFSLFFLAVALTPVWQAIPIFLFICGISLLMLHNALQLRASQMAPETRGAAMSAFAASFFLGQLGGVAVGGLLYDYLGGAAVVASGAILFAAATLICRIGLAQLGPPLRS